MSKVLVLGAGSQVVSVAAALAMVDAACGVEAVEVVDEYVIRVRPHRFEPPVLAVWSPGSCRADSWYQQFAGRRGKPPRY